MIHPIKSLVFVQSNTEGHIKQFPFSGSVFLLELQIREGVEDNSKIIFVVAEQIYMLWLLIRTVLRPR